MGRVYSRERGGERERDWRRARVVSGKSASTVCACPRPRSFSCAVSPRRVSPLGRLSRERDKTLRVSLSSCSAGEPGGSGWARLRLLAGGPGEKSKSFPRAWVVRMSANASHVRGSTKIRKEEAVAGSSDGVFTWSDGVKMRRRRRILRLHSQSQPHHT